MLEAIVHSSDDAIITKNLDGLITSWNPAATRIFGYTPDEIVGESVLRLIPDDLQHQESDILRRLRVGEQISHFETTRVTKDGRYLVVSLTISPVRDRHGCVVGVSKIVRDITAQKGLDDARFQLAAIVESSDDAILSKDLNGIIKSWNQAAQRLFGYTAEEVIGASVLRLIPEELQSEEKDILKKLRAGERIDHFETTRVRKNGERFDVSLTISPIKDSSGLVIGASKVLRNVSKRKQLERSLIQAEKLAATGRMAATIAHEINNPLEAVLNLIYLARSNSSQTEVVSFLSAAEEELGRLALIAKQTLGYYRDQNVPKLVSIEDLLSDALRIYDSKFRNAGIAVQTRFSCSRKVPVKSGEVMQVISNLLANAIYAMPLGGKLLSTATDADMSGREGVLFTIEDDGVGIPEQNLPMIFEPFFTTRGAIGTGIGLWIAKQFVEGHGGFIEVDSRTDNSCHGTRIRVYLPSNDQQLVRTSDPRTDTV